MADLPVRRSSLKSVVEHNAPPKLKVVSSEETELGRPINQEREQRNRHALWFFIKLVGGMVTAALVVMTIINVVVVKAALPSSNFLKEAKSEIVAEVGKVVRDNIPQQQKVVVEAKLDSESAAIIQTAVQREVQAAGLVIARDSPFVKKLEAENSAKQRMIDDLSRAKRQTEAKLQKVSAEKAELVDQLDIVQQKLEKASDTDRSAIVKDAVAHLSRDDVEALLILEKLSVRESSGNVRAYGPWVVLRDGYGKPKKGPHNPWIKVVRGVPHDRAYGFAQIMGENIPSWSEEATGIRYTPEQLVKEPDTYRKVALFQIRKLLQKYDHNPDDVLSVWHSGRRLKQAANSRDVNLSTPEYVKSVKSASTTDKWVWRNARKN